MSSTVDPFADLKTRQRSGTSRCRDGESPSRGRHRFQIQIVRIGTPGRHREIDCDACCPEQGLRKPRLFAGPRIRAERRCQARALSA
jgi:hypothetical protein